MAGRFCLADAGSGDPAYRVDDLHAVGPVPSPGISSAQREDESCDFTAAPAFSGRQRRKRSGKMRNCENDGKGFGSARA